MSDFPEHPPGKIVRAEEADAWVDGFALLERARHQAAEADASARRAHESGREEGYALGLGEGRIQAGELVVAATDQIQEYLDSLSAPVARLALDIVQRVLGEFDETELVARCARHALSDLRNEMRVVVRVAPGKVEALEAAIATLDDDARDRVSRIEADGSLAATQCLLVSPMAVIDIGLDAQLDSIRRALATRPGAP